MMHKCFKVAYALTEDKRAISNLLYRDSVRYKSIHITFLYTCLK